MISGFSRQWTLILASAIALINFEQCGSVLGWSSPLLVFLESKTSPIPISADQGSWLTTMPSFISLFTLPIPFICIQKLGPKFSLAISLIPYGISWILIATATNYTQLIIGRGIAGIGLVFTYTVTPIYLGEISPNHIRGRVGIFMTVVSNIGILKMYSLGLTESVFMSSLLAVLPIILFPILYFWLPESPYYLQAQGNTNKAIQSLKKLRQSDDVQDELRQIEKTILEHTNDYMSLLQNIKELFNKSNLRALFICGGCITLYHCTGTCTVLFYAGVIFDKAGNVSPTVLTIIQAAILLAFSIESARIVEHWGKIPLLIISCVGTIIFMTILGVYFYFHDSGYNVESFGWVPLTSLILFNIGQMVGLIPIPVAFLAEMFHPKVKTIAVCVCKFLMAALTVSIGKAFQIISDSFGNAIPFFIFAAFGALGIPFILCFVPETKGRSLEDIQYYMTHKTFRESTEKDLNKS